jgi:hypothetical protein
MLNRYREQAHSYKGGALIFGLIAFTAGWFSVVSTFQNNKNRLSNEPESQPAA